MPFAPVAKILTTTKSIPKQDKKTNKQKKTTSPDVTQSNQSSEAFENVSSLPSFSQM